MRPRSARFDRAMVSSSQTTRCKIDMMYNRQVVATGLNLQSGSIDYDSTSTTLAAGSLTLIEPSRIPTRATPGVVTPFGYELVIYGGVVYGPGDEELLQIGVFPIGDVMVDGTTLAAEVAFTDRSQLVRDARLEDDWVVPAGANIGAQIQALIADGVPGLEYDFVSTSYTSVEKAIPAGSDRWDEAIGLARDCGGWLHMGSRGQVVLRPELVSNEAAPVWTFKQGPGGTLKTANVRLTRPYNRTVAVGSDPTLGFIPRGVATDNDPVTGYTSGFGHKPRFYASPFLRSDAQAELAAASVQASDSGTAWGVEFEAVTHFGLEPRDPVRVIHDRLGVDGAYLMETFTLDLAASGTMGATL